MAVVLAVQKWRHYLLGRKFIIHSDQRSLKHLVDQQLMGEGQQKWITKLLGFDFEIRYKEGKENGAADALSRCLSLGAISSVTFQEWEGLEEEVQADDCLKKIIQGLIGGSKEPEGYELRRGRLYYKGRIVIPKNSPRIQMLLQEFHDSVLGGHSGFFRTYKRISGLVWWEGMRQTIQRYIQQCEVCSRNKYLTLSPAGLLQPLPIPSRVWEDISMDFIGGLPKSHGLDTILVVVDRLSKYVHFLGLNHPYTAKSVADLFVKEIVRLHGFPSSIVTDRDRIFMSNFWSKLFKQAGTKLKFSSAYHPQSDGQTEVVNRCLETYLRCFAGAKPKQWSKWLPWAELWFNTTYHSAAHSSPYKILYGREPPTLIRGGIQPSTVEDVNQLLAERNSMIDELKWYLNKAQERMKIQADKKRREVEFEKGEKVFLKIQPYRMKSLANHVNQKLSPRYYGPFEVMERVGKVAYRLLLPPDSQVHPVFHASLLKKCLAPEAKCQPLPKGLTEGWELQVQPEAVLATRKNEQGEEEVLIYWKNLPEFESSWELAADIKLNFPDFHLEDKVVVQEGGIVRDKFAEPIKVYRRRKYRGSLGIGLMTDSSNRGGSGGPESEHEA